VTAPTTTPESARVAPAGVAQQRPGRIGDLGALAAVKAALDAGLFIDPVTVLGLRMSRRDACRIERELIAQLRGHHDASSVRGVVA